MCSPALVPGGRSHRVRSARGVRVYLDCSTSACLWGRLGSLNEVAHYFSDFISSLEISSTSAVMNQMAARN